MARNGFQLVVTACMGAYWATMTVIAGPVEDSRALAHATAGAVEKVARDMPGKRGGSPRDDPTGACCDFGGLCSTESQNDCDLAGGTFLGAGTSCSPNPCPQPIECQFVGFTWAEQPPPYPMTDPWSTSESDENTGTTASEIFFAAGWITDVRWYGLYGTPSGACTRGNDDFIITIFEDAAGPGWGPTQPGARVIAQHTVAAARVPAITDGDFDGLQLQRFTATLPTRCAAFSGWIQIQAASDGTNCRFLWMSSNLGDGSSWANGAPVARDLSICLEGSDGSDVVGACCDDGLGTCNEEPFAFFGCSGPGFRFTSDVACGDVTPPCGEVTGACCDPTTGDCTDATGPDCEALWGFGNWQGAYSTCTPISPCKGACCALDAGTCTVETEDDCLGIVLGQYMGDGTDCTTAICPGAGRCCRNDGALCDTRTEASCTALGGDGWIADETCATSPCPAPQPNDSCATAMLIEPPFPATRSGNNTLGLPDTTPTCGTSTPFQGLWYEVIGTGNTMTASTCDGAAWDTRIQVFCQSCIDLPCVAGNDDDCDLQSSVSWCSAAGASYYLIVGGHDADEFGPFTLTLEDDGTACIPDDTCGSSGSCCLSDGSCEDWVEAACTAAGGTYGGEATACGTLGACCIPIYGCLISDQTCCEAADGLFMGEGTDCAGDPCLEGTGACCVDDTTCNEGWTFDACEAAGGRYLGIATACEEGICLIPGACCDITDGSCTEVTIMTCDSQGGIYHGDQVTCIEATCPGACCFGAMNCEFLDPTDCDDGGGLFMGEAVTCASIECPACENCPSSYTDDGTGGDVPDDAIYNVTFGDINNTTGAELGSLSYGDYLYLSTVAAPGGTYTLSVTADGCNDPGAGTYSQDVWAWIDWNQNCVFDHPDEAYDLGATGSVCSVTLTIPVTVPLDAMTGTTAMRVIEEYNSDPGPCDGDGLHATTYGETEDYTVIVTGALGACCLPDGSCETVIQVSCISAGGVHQGALTTCDVCDCTTCLADVSGDNVVNGLDVVSFTDCYLGITPYNPCADIDSDLDVNDVDLNTFVTLLVNETGPCSSVPVCTTCAGDASGDGKCDGADIDMFVRCILDQAGLCPCADMNGDLDVTLEDIEAFIDAIVNWTGDCP